MVAKDKIKKVKKVIKRQDCSDAIEEIRTKFGAGSIMKLGEVVVPI